MSQSDFIRTSMEYGGWDPSSIFEADGSRQSIIKGRDSDGRDLKFLDHEKRHDINEDVSHKEIDLSR